MKTIKPKHFILIICFWACSFNLIATESISFTWGGKNKLFEITATKDKQFTINWGDGSKIDTITATGNWQTISYAYSIPEWYSVIITGITDDCLFTDLDFDVEIFNINYVKELDLSACFSLQTLSCNGLSNLDVSNNLALMELRCAVGQLSSLDVSNNTALTYLDCSSNNMMSSLDVSKNTALAYLDCRGNRLSSLDVSNNKYLTYLNCGYNSLSSLDVSKNTALEILYCDVNQLSNLNVSNIATLTDLRCGHNQLSSLNVDDNVALRYLFCAENQICSLDVSKNTALQKLWCSSNQLKDLDVSHIKLIELMCSNNQLISLDVSSSNELKTLMCGKNQLSSLKVSKTAFSNLTYYNSSSLTQYRRSHNKGSQNVQNSEIVLCIGFSCDSNRLLLSELYNASKMIKCTRHNHIKSLGTQILIPQIIQVGKSVDFSAQKEFDGIATVFSVEKDGVPASSNDYKETKGIITFKKKGNYTVTMTNSAIVSIVFDSDELAKVIADITVKR